MLVLNFGRFYHICIFLSSKELDGNLLDFSSGDGSFTLLVFVRHLFWPLQICKTNGKPPNYSLQSFQSSHKEEAPRLPSFC